MEYNKILKNTYNSKLSHSSSYVCTVGCRSKYGKKVLANNKSFQNDIISRETKLSISFEKLSLSQSLCLKYSKISSSLKFSSYSAKLDGINTTKYYANSIVSSKNGEHNYLEYTRNNLYPPLLSTLQIFAISTEPLDIQVRLTKSIPSDMNETTFVAYHKLYQEQITGKKIKHFGAIAIWFN